MSLKCIACKNQIELDASVCSQCGSFQNRPLNAISIFTNPITLFISILSLIISLSALYLSNQKSAPAPDLYVQLIDYENDSLSFYVANLGELPTLVRAATLRIRLAQGSGFHELEVYFELPPSALESAEAEYFEIPFSDFISDWSSWSISEPEPEDSFTKSFLYFAATLGDNLHCELRVYFPAQGYFPNNISSGSDTTNGDCSAAMAWFADEIGPLKPTE